MSSSLTYSPILVSGFLLNCPSLSPWLKARLAHCIPYNNKLNLMCVNTTYFKLKRDREMRLLTLIYLLFMQEDLMT